MALPNNPADLFGQKNNLPAVPSALTNPGYKITWDAVDDEDTPPEIRAQLAGLYTASRQRPDRALAERLRLLVQQYPDVPALKNYLTITYTLTGQKSRADAVLEQTLNQHPHYLMGKVNKAHQLLIDGDSEGVEKLFGGPPTTLAALYPERSEFHASEVAHFTHMAFEYWCIIGDPDTAEDQLRLLRDLHYHTTDQLRTMKQHLDLARIKANLARMQEGLADAVTVDGYFRAADQQTTEPPVYEHPEIRWLYEYGYELPADKRDVLLALPRPSLTADLSKALLDIVYRYEFFQEQDWDEKRHNFASHALLLATELRADDCLNAVLETLRQGNDFQEFWWGDYLSDFYEPYFRRMLPSRADDLKAFMQEPDVNTYAKAVISEAYAQETLANPALKPAAQTWYADVLTFLIDHDDDEHLFDSDLIAFVVGDVTDLQLTNLLPLIQIAYSRKLVTENIHGDLSDTERDMVKPTYPPDRKPLRPLAEHYEYLRDPTAYRKAHPDPEREKRSADFMKELEAKDDEWRFLYDDEADEPMPNSALFPSQQKQLLPGLTRPSQPIIRQPAPERNDKVSVRYTDGTIVRDVKYKKVETDVLAGKCELL